MRSRAPVLALAAALLAGLATIVVKGVGTPRPGWGGINVPAWHPVAEVPADRTACQQPVYAEEDFSWLAFTPDRPEADAIAGHPRPPVRVSVRGDRTGAVLATAALPADRTPGGPREVALSEVVRADEPVRICFTNAGRHGLMLWGVGAPQEAQDDPYIAGAVLSQSDLLLDGQRVAGDLFIEMGSGPRQTRSLLATVPRALERAARFKLPLGGAAGLWILLGLLTLAVPGLLGAALLHALRADQEPAAPSAGPGRGDP